VRSHLHFARKSLRWDADLLQVATEHGPNGHGGAEEGSHVGRREDLENVPVGSGSQDIKSEGSEAHKEHRS
jgi:hypothetical protein